MRSTVSRSLVTVVVGTGAANISATFRQALTLAADRRDWVAQHLAKLENQQAVAVAKIKRLPVFKKSAEAQRLEGYVPYVIKSLGNDAKDLPLNNDRPGCALYTRSDRAQFV